VIGESEERLENWAKRWRKGDDLAKGKDQLKEDLGFQVARDVKAGKRKRLIKTGLLL